MEVTDSELAQLLGGTADNNLKRKLAAQLDSPGDDLTNRMACLQKALSEPFRVDWQRLLECEHTTDNRCDDESFGGQTGASHP